MAINLPTPRAQPKGEVWFIAIKAEALGINYNNNNNSNNNNNFIEHTNKGVQDI